VVLHITVALLLVVVVVVLPDLIQLILLVAIVQVVVNLMTIHYQLTLADQQTRFFNRI
jgi:hypothetical protein